MNRLIKSIIAKAEEFGASLAGFTTIALILEIKGIFLTAAFFPDILIFHL
jgi:hypothetical protein